MDPATAFGIAVGVLQVLDLSFKALATCRELYRDGSLAENEGTREVTQDLANTVDLLKASTGQTPTSTSQDAATKDVMEISEKCSQTAAELLKELSKLQLDSKSDLRKVMRKTFQAMRRKSFIEKVQNELKEYQRILDTRILVKLDAHALQQREDFRNLDHNVRDLAVKMNEGRNTFAQLLADDRQAVLDHIDRGFAKHAQLNADIDAQQQFKKSLFFPEILSRQEQISEAHRGTCCWIFSAPNARNTNYKRSQPWSSFVDWLEQGNGVYWLSGKPGSGKSTLMNYITSEHRTKEALTKWANGCDLVTASFYFWKPGTDLQKSFQGLLRSLLYQIADQRDDLIYIMMNGQASLAKGPTESLGSVGMHEWTVKRLLSVLRHFFIQKPSSVRICFFIDGLDEFDGEEDDLLKIIRFISQTAQVKICVSSRRLPIFLQAFQDSPQLNQQDFNRGDIEKTANDKLRPKLKGSFPSDEKETEKMVKDVCDKAQGVFLWLDLTIKALVNAIRNGDTMDELSMRLQTTPDTIEGLYRHMLNRLDNLYLATAVRYFRLLKENQSLSGRPCTLLGFVCVDYPLWQHVLNNDLAYFESSDFSDTCHKIESRILTRCAGLVEINDHPSNVFERMRIYDYGEGIPELRTHQGERFVSRHFREVNFIHRSVLDYLETHHQEFFQAPNWHLEAKLALARSQLGEMSVIPIVKSELYKEGGFVKIGRPISSVMNVLAAVDESEATETADRAFQQAACEMVDQTFHVIEQVHLNINCSTTPWYEEYSGEDFGESGDNRLRFHDCHGFAAYFGCRHYVSHYLSLHNCSLEECDYLLTCTAVGLDRIIDQYGERERYLAIIEELVRRGTDPNLLIHGHSWLTSGYLREVSACGIALENLISFFQTTDIDRNWRTPGFYILFVKTLLSHGADVNTSIFSTFWAEWESTSTKPPHEVELGLEESLLSYMERYMTPEGPDLLKEISNLLRSHGALQRRRCRVIQFLDFVESESSGVRSVWSPSYQLSQEQSDRIVESCEWKFEGYYKIGPQETRPSTDALARVAAEIRSSLTEADIVDKSTYVLRSSFKSEVDET